jgi:hypothetical protein
LRRGLTKTPKPTLYEKKVLPSIVKLSPPTSSPVSFDSVGAQSTTTSSGLSGFGLATGHQARTGSGKTNSCQDKNLSLSINGEATVSQNHRGTLF